MAQLIVNADDLGMHPAIDRGILEAHANGVLTSTTVLVTGRTARSAVQQAQRQGLAMGVHLAAVTRLAPAADPASVRSLAPGGFFRASWLHFLGDIARGRISLEELRLEWEAQIALAADLGFQPDHLDTHQHLHLLPGIQSIVVDLAHKHRLPVRVPTARILRWRPSLTNAKVMMLSALGLGLRFRVPQTVAMVGIDSAGGLDEAQFIALLDRLPSGVTELGCHPGLHPGVVPEDPLWAYDWDLELRCLTSQRVKDALSARRISLTTYAEAFATRATNKI